MMILLGLSAAIVIPRLVMIVDSPDGLGWWWLLIGPLLFLAVCLGALALEWLFALVEYLTLLVRRCPKCGSRHWSRGFTRGFGV